MYMRSVSIPSVTFFVIAYGQDTIVRSCLKKLTSHYAKSDIWLIDNASPNSLAPIAKKFGVQCARLEENRGYSGGCNAAVKIMLEKSRADVCCLLNSDVFCNEQFVRELPNELLRLMHDPDLALIQPVLYVDEHKRQVENTGIRYFQSGLAFQSMRDSGRVVVNGACMLLKRKALQNIIRSDGYCFEELFWSYAEDVELSLRLLSRGYKIDVSPSLAAQHLGSVSFGKGSSRSRYLYARNLFWTLSIAWDERLIRANLFAIILGQIRIIIEFIVSGEIRTYLHIWQETWRKRKILREKRENFQGKKTHDFFHFLQGGSFPIRR